MIKRTTKAAKSNKDKILSYLKRRKKPATMAEVHKAVFGNPVVSEFDKMKADSRTGRYLRHLRTEGLVESTSLDGGRVGYLLIGS